MKEVLLGATVFGFLTVVDLIIALFLPNYLVSKRVIAPLELTMGIYSACFTGATDNTKPDGCYSVRNLATTQGLDPLRPCGDIIDKKTTALAWYVVVAAALFLIGTFATLFCAFLVTVRRTLGRLSPLIPATFFCISFIFVALALYASHDVFFSRWDGGDHCANYNAICVDGSQDTRTGAVPAPPTVPGATKIPAPFAPVVTGLTAMSNSCRWGASMWLIIVAFILGAAAVLLCILAMIFGDPADILRTGNKASPHERGLVRLGDENGHSGEWDTNQRPRSRSRAGSRSPQSLAKLAAGSSSVPLAQPARASLPAGHAHPTGHDTPEPPAEVMYPNTYSSPVRTNAQRPMPPTLSATQLGLSDYASHPAFGMQSHTTTGQPGPHAQPFTGAPNLAAQPQYNAHVPQAGQSTAPVPMMAVGAPGNGLLSAPDAAPPLAHAIGGNFHTDNMSPMASPAYAGGTQPSSPQFVQPQFQQPQQMGSMAFQPAPQSPHSPHHAFQSPAQQMAPFPSIMSSNMSALHGTFGMMQPSLPLSPSAQSAAIYEPGSPSAAIERAAAAASAAAAAALEAANAAASAAAAAAYPSSVPGSPHSQSPPSAAHNIPVAAQRSPSPSWVADPSRRQASVDLHMYQTDLPYSRAVVLAIVSHTMPPALPSSPFRHTCASHRPPPQVHLPPSGPLTARPRRRRPSGEAW